ncbi:hypothetical protein BC629DRAFT_1435903 [Irpex lacteus]|nr:hypothetical protein BC629DRAFT_1435903 [Irpex lacteus]
MHHTLYHGSFVLSFDLVDLYKRLTDLCPTVEAILRSFCTTSKQRRELNEKTALRKQLRIGTAMLTLLGERSQQNSYFKHVIATYLYATGASRQALSVIAHLGISSSYPTIAAGSSDLPQGSKNTEPEVGLLSEKGSLITSVTQLANDPVAEEAGEDYGESEESGDDLDNDSIIASDSDGSYRWTLEAARVLLVKP